MAVTYTYQVQYELCSLIILYCLTVQFFLSKRFPTITSNLFSTILVVSIADISLDILGALAVNSINSVPIVLNYIVNSLFYCLQILIPLLMFVYVIHAVGYHLRADSAFSLLLLPAVVFLVIMIINPFTGLVFSISGEPGNLHFYSGPLSIFLYACAAFYMVTIMVLVTIFRERLSSKQIGTAVFFNVICAGAMVFQIFNPDILMTGTAITVSIMLWDLTLQNPDDMIDEETGAFDTEGLKLFLQRELSLSQVHAAVIEIDGLSATERGEGNVANTNLMWQIGTFFTNLLKTRVWYFRDAKTRFWVCARNAAELDNLSTRIVNRFASVWEVGGMSIDLMAKVLCFSTNTSLKMSSAELMSIIDECMGMDNVIVRQKTELTIDSSMLAKLRRRNILEESMRRSIISNEGFYLCYQPIIHTDHPDYASAEVLLRYNDANLGAVSPAEFMPLAEECGLSVFVDNFVVDKACMFLAANPSIQLLHINLSAAGLYSNPVKRLTDSVEKYGVDPRRICIEITETAAAGNPELLNAFMEEMISKGFSFALDDYGTGYSNVFQVMNLPFKTVKIDRSLLEDQRNSRLFLKGTIRIFLDLGIEPVIEGIENRQQLDMVKELGAQTMQGFFFSPPLLDNDYADFVKSGNRIKK